MRKILFIPLILLVMTFTGCGNQNHSRAEKIESKKMAASNQLVKEKVNVPIQNPSHERVVDFGEFTVILREKSTKNSSLEKIKQNTDTISLTAFAGWMSGLEIEIVENGNVDSFKVNQKVVNTVTITFGEGQFEQWDSYTEIDTNWTPIILVNNYLFTLLDYDGTNWRRDRLQKYFKDLQAKILTYDGVFINKNRIKSANKIEELPLEIWASQIIIKIKASIKGEPVSKFIIFNPTYGC